MDFDLAKLIKQALEKAHGERGKATVLIAGRTGVGKSTLINAVFQGDIAVTGQGRPVTKETREYSKEGVPLTILDTRGLELARFKDVIAELRAAVADRNRQQDANKHIHVAWICISEDSRRVEQADIELLEMLEENGVPTIGVVTKAREDKGFRAEVQKLLVNARNVVRVRAIAEKDDEDGHERQKMGLEQLVELTMEIVPEGQRSAFAAAQRVSVEHKARRAHIVVAAAALSAGGAAVTPIPFADFAIVVPIEITMLASIGAVFGLKLERAFLTTIITTAFCSAGGALGRKALLAGLLKLIPGAGTVAGGVMGAAMAAAFTTVLGEAYIAVLQLFFKDPDHEPSADEIGKALKTKLQETQWSDALGLIR